MNYKLNSAVCHQEINRKALEHLQANGWTLDNFGHAKKQIGDSLYRFKFQSTLVRKEVRGTAGQWIRLKSIPYGKLVFK